jgi:hypothetical protein
MINQMGVLFQTAACLFGRFHLAIRDGRHFLTQINVGINKELQKYSCWRKRLIKFEDNG